MAEGRPSLREIVGPTDAALECATEIEGILVNGVDLIRCNDARRMNDFKVMVRPLQAVNLLHQHMGLMLAQLKQGTAPSA